MKNRVRSYFKHDFLKEILAVLLYGIAVETFIAPNQIISGGVTGIALIINSLSGIPIGTLNFLLNVPLFVMGFRRLGRGFIISTMRVVFLLFVSVDFVMPFFPKYHGEKLLAALFGGALFGMALAIILTNGGSTGGSDIVVKLMLQKRPYISLGNMVMSIDLVIVLFGAVVYRDIETILFGLVLIYVSGEVINRVVKGNDAKWMVLAVSEKRSLISQSILNEVCRGTTLIDAHGGYSGKEAKILLSVADAREMFAIKKIIMRCDPAAFIIVAQASEILGEGFKKLENQ